jgi:lysosomal acid lipase/cholesteryl ester hydrolase
MMVWVVNDPELAPAFQIARAGYDVWLGNNRGTKYGLKHTTLSTDSDEFWDFDQETMGMHDLPAIIDHVLAQTNSTSLKYIGHSEGTT